MLHLAYAYSAGRQGCENEEAWYLAAYHAGSREAAFLLGCMYFRSKDYDKAVPFYKAGLEANDPQSMSWLAQIYFRLGELEEARHFFCWLSRWASWCGNYGGKMYAFRQVGLPATLFRFFGQSRSPVSRPN